MATKEEKLKLIANYETSGLPKAKCCSTDGISISTLASRRKNWLFSNTVNGATSSTIIYGIIQTAIAHNLIPEKYLTYVFTQIQYGKDVNTYLPWSEQIPEYCKSKKPQQK